MVSFNRNKKLGLSIRLWFTTAYGKRKNNRHDGHMEQTCRDMPRDGTRLPAPTCTQEKKKQIYSIWVDNVSKGPYYHINKQTYIPWQRNTVVLENISYLTFKPFVWLLETRGSKGKWNFNNKKKQKCDVLLSIHLKCAHFKHSYNKLLHNCGDTVVQWL